MSELQSRQESFYEADLVLGLRLGRAREGVRNGSDFALVSGGKLYTLKGDKPMIDKLAGHYVAIHGKVSSTTITVFTMTAK